MSDLLSRLMNAMLFTSMVAIGVIWVQAPKGPIAETQVSVVLQHEVAD